MFKGEPESVITLKGGFVMEGEGWMDIQEVSGESDVEDVLAEIRYKFSKHLIVPGTIYVTFILKDKGEGKAVKLKRRFRLISPVLD